jgi:ParB family chromosome partitioning protein
MGKLDELMKTAGSHAAESVARRELPAIHRASPPAQAPSGKLAGVSRSKGAAEIPTDKIGPDPDQPRQEFDDEDIEHLAGSIRTRGVLQPLRVRWDEGRSMYVLICGERRWRASQRAGLVSVPCNIVEGRTTPTRS